MHCIEFTGYQYMRLHGNWQGQQVCFLHAVNLSCRWEAGQRLYMKLLLHLYNAAAAGSSSVPLEERCAAAGGVPASLITAFKSVLEDSKLDGSFKVRCKDSAPQ